MIEYATQHVHVTFVASDSARTCSGCGAQTLDPLLVATGAVPAPTGTLPLLLCQGCIRHGMMAARSAHRQFRARMKERGIG